MIRWVNKSVVLKITLLTTAVMVIAFGGVITFFNARSRDALMDVERHGSLHYARFVHRSLTQFMQKNEREELQRAIEEGGRSEGLEFLRIVDAEERVAYSSRTGELDKAVSTPSILRLLERARTGEEEALSIENGTSITAVALRSTDQCVECHAPLGKYLGAIVIGHDIHRLEEELGDNRVTGFWLFVGAVAAVVLLLQGLLRITVLSPLFRLVEGAKALARGDLTYDISYKSEDEVGQLADHLRAMEGELRQSIGEMEELTRAIGKATEELNGSSETLVGVSAEQASGAAEQAAAVHEVSSTSQQIAATSSQISNNVENIRAMTEETYRACVRGREDVNRAVTGMETVRQKVQGIADATVELGRKSQRIGGVVSLIDEISKEIHLLALNAAIEAAGAGEHGKRFSVVAAEVRRLAERTADATGQIRSLIEEILETTNETVLTTERGTTIVLDGTSKVDLIGETLDVLLRKVEATRESSKEMAVATQQQALAGEQLVVTITDINSVALQVSRAAEQVEKRALALKTTARELLNLSEKTRSGKRFKV